MRQPAFWTAGRGGWRQALLTPAAGIFQLATGLRRKLATPWQAPLPVICVGNVTAGGAGKTPVALDIGRHLLSKDRRCHFLSRGYGGTATGPVQVDPATHTATGVGDEPLLLAAVAPTWVAADRAAGIQRAATAGADIIVMDDGFQNPGVTKDLSLLVIDGGFGVGNASVMPAGPLREPLAAALARAHAVVFIGADVTGLLPDLPATLPVLRASIRPATAAAPVRPVLAFAGIGRPEKFFETLMNAGYQIAETVAFADHHPFSTTDLDDLRRRAANLEADLITTEKDLARLAPSERAGIVALTVTLQWDDETALDSVLESCFPHAAAP